MARDQRRSARVWEIVTDAAGQLRCAELVLSGAVGPDAYHPQATGSGSRRGRGGRSRAR